MTTMTVNLPDSVFFELKQIAAFRHVSTESLLVEIALHNFKEMKAEQRFLERAARGNPERGLALLEKMASRGTQTN